MNYIGMENIPMMRYVVVWGWVLGVLLIPVQLHRALADEYGRTGSLVVFIKSNKPKYEIGEPIYITVSLENHTAEPLIVNKRLDPLLDIEWDLFYENLGGNLTLKQLPPVALTPDDFVRLEVNETVGKQLQDLTAIVNGQMKQGRYAVRLTYRNQEALKGKETWVGVTVTNQLWIEVKPSEKI